MKCSRERESNNADILRRLKPSKDDGFMLEQSCKDFSQGFCSQPMGKTQLLSTLKGRRFRLIPRCVITQANGKQRIIDDAARGGQSELCSDQNKLVLCTPLRPAQQIAAVAAGMPDDLWNHCCHADRWLGAGEDWLQASIAIRRLGLTKRLLVSWSSGMMNGKNRFSGLQQFVVWFAFGGG